MQKNQVEIRGITELFTAEFAVGDDDEARFIAMPSFKVVPRQFQCCRQDQIGQRTEVIGESFQRQFAAEVQSQQAQGLRVLEVAQRTHLAFAVTGGFRQLALQRRFQTWPVGFLVQIA